MKKLKKNNRLLINQDKKQKIDIIGALFQLIAVLIGIYSFVMVFSEGLRLTYNKDLVFLTVIFTALIYTAVFLFPDYIKYSLPILLLIILTLFWKNKAYVIDGLYHIENSVIYLINDYYHLNTLRYATEHDMNKSVTTFLISFTQIIAILTVGTVYYGIWKQVIYILSILMLGLLFAVGINPPELQFLLLTVFLIYLTVSGFVPVQELPKTSYSRYVNIKLMIYSQRRRTRSGICAAGIFLILFLLVIIIYPSAKHNQLEGQRQQVVSRIRYRVEDIDIESLWYDMSDKFMDVFFADDKRLINITRDSGTVMYGGLSGGKLSRSGSIAFTNETALKLTLPADTNLVYLKGFVGTEYKEDSWHPLSEDNESNYQELLIRYSGRYNAQNQLGSYYQHYIEHPFTVFSIRNIEILNRNKDFSKIAKSRMVVDYINVDENYVFVPYSLDEIKPNVVTEVSDSYYKPRLTSRVYYYSFYDISIDNMINAAGGIKIDDNPLTGLEEEEKEDFGNYLNYISEYDQYVMDAYLHVPENLEGLTNLAYSLKSISLRNQISSSIVMPARNNQEYIYRYQMIDIVKSYLSSYEYTLSPGKVPDGYDYAEYFLLDNKKGYCAHFATTATLLLRCMGVPARYVEGYVVTREDIHSGIPSGEEEIMLYTWISEDGKDMQPENVTKELTTVEIRDTNAHAWVEVYFDGYGWIPIEMTSGYSSSGYNINSEIQSYVQDFPEPTKLPVNTPTPIPELTIDPKLLWDFEKNKEEDVYDSYQQENQGGSSDGTDAKGGTGGIAKFIQKYKNLDPTLKGIINVIMLILLFVIIISIRYAVISMRIKTRITNGGRKKKVLWLYHEMERFYKWLYIKKMEEQTYMNFAEEVTRYGQAPRNFEKVMEIILRSSFSSEHVTEEEYIEVYECYAYFRNTIYNRAGRNKRKWIKYFVVI